MPILLQVVAGMDYALLVDGYIVCPGNATSDPSELMGANITLAAKVYQPLGTAPAEVCNLFIT